jgi:hypothetical protein
MHQISVYGVAIASLLGLAFPAAAGEVQVNGPTVKVPTVKVNPSVRAVTQVPTVAGGKTNGTTDPRELVKVNQTFQRIGVSNNDNKKGFQDNWGGSTGGNPGGSNSGNPPRDPSHSAITGKRINGTLNGEVNNTSPVLGNSTSNNGTPVLSKGGTVRCRSC